MTTYTVITGSALAGPPWNIPIGTVLGLTSDVDTPDFVPYIPPPYVPPIVTISADPFLLDRANHTGFESADVLIDGATNRLFSTAEKSRLAGIAAGATVNLPDATLLNRVNHSGVQAISTVTGLQAALDSAAATGGTSSDSIIIARRYIAGAWELAGSVGNAILHWFGPTMPPIGGLYARSNKDIYTVTVS